MQSFSSTLANCLELSSSYTLEPQGDKGEFSQFFSIDYGANRDLLICDMKFPWQLLNGLPLYPRSGDALPRATLGPAGPGYTVTDLANFSFLTSTFILECPSGKESLRVSFSIVEARYHLAAHLQDQTEEFFFSFWQDDIELYWWPKTQQYELDILHGNVHYIKSFSPRASKLIYEWLIAVVAKCAK